MTYLLSKNYEDKAPVFLQDPYIDGTPQVGNTLTVRWFVPGYSATDPDWSVAYQWYWGPANTTLTEEEFDETGQTLTCTADHLTGYLSCRVAVTNPSGTVVKFAANAGPVTDYSAPSGTVVSAPQFNQPATLVGTPQAGRTLSVNYDVSEVPGVSYSYQFTWYRDSDGVDSGSPPSPEEVISGAGASQYVPTGADVGKHIKCRVRCTNLAGTTDSTTGYSSQIAAADDSVPVGAIVIDAGWLASTTNGGPNGPWILKQSGGYYLFDTDVTQAPPPGARGAMFYVANTNITVDLNGHTITYHSGTAPATPSTATNIQPEATMLGNVGICLYIAFHNTEISIPGAAFEPLGCVVKNGTLAGAGTGSYGSAIYGQRTCGISIKDMRIEAPAGRDAFCISFKSAVGGATEITDNVLIANTLTSHNRHGGPANVLVPNGVSYIARNAIIGGNSGIVCGGGSLVEQNVISHRSTVTNGYAVWLYRNSGVTVRNNVCIPLTGRGMLWNAGSNHLCTDNVFLHLEEQNAEFGGDLDPPAVRARYDFSNCTYANNFSLGFASSAYTAAISLYIGPIASGTVPSSAYNNTGYVVFSGAITDATNDSAKCFALEGFKPPGRMDIFENAFYSNHFVVGVEGSDGECITDNSYPIRRNTLGFADGDTAYAAFVTAVDTKLATFSLTSDVLAAATSRVNEIKTLMSGLLSGVAVRSDAKFWYSMFLSLPSHCDIVDTTFAGGSSPLSWGGLTTARTGVKVYRDLVSANVRILDGPAQAVANQQVTVSPVVVATDHPNGDIYTTTTDASGYAELLAIRNALTRNASPGDLAAQTETHVDVSVAGVGSKRVAIGDFPSLTELDLTS